VPLRECKVLNRQSYSKKQKNKSQKQKQKSNDNKGTIEYVGMKMMMIERPTNTSTWNLARHYLNEKLE
jgi:hypothetical protein